MRQRRDLLFGFRRENLPSLLAFVLPTLATSGVLASALVYQHTTDPLFGTHSPRALSMDLFSPFVWGYYWPFRDSVRSLWFPLSPYVTEASVYLGLSVIALVVYAVRQRTTTRINYFGYGCGIAVFFGVMSLGPNLHVGGHELSLGHGVRFMGHDDVNLLVLPHAVLWLIFPPWRLAGVPLRMMVMVQLAAAILAAGGLRALLTSSWRWRRWATAALLSLLVFDYLPAPMRLTDPGVPAYVNALKDLPEGAVLDLASNAPLALYFQTVHRAKTAITYRPPLETRGAFLPRLSVRRTAGSSRSCADRTRRDLPAWPRCGRSGHGNTQVRSNGPSAAWLKRIPNGEASRPISCWS